MYASDRLKERRKQMDESGGSPAPQESGKPSNRELMLTDEEKKSLSSYQPGAEVQCLVKGRMDGEGKLQVTSVQPIEGEQEAAPEMPSMRMNPMVTPG